MEINPVFTKVKTISPIESIESSIGTNNEQLQSIRHSGGGQCLDIQFKFLFRNSTLNSVVTINPPALLELT